MPDPVRITKSRDGCGWRRVRCGGNRKSVLPPATQSLILDDRNGQVCVVHPWVAAEHIPNLIAALVAAAAECGHPVPGADRWM